jgi:hypothetical protein
VALEGGEETGRLHQGCQRRQAFEELRSRLVMGGRAVATMGKKRPRRCAAGVGRIPDDAHRAPSG